VKSLRAARKRAILCVLAVFVTLPGMSRAAEEWPTRPIIVVVPFAAGGSLDRVARAFAPFLGKELNVPIVIENRAGASGQVGVQYFLQRPVDGYTLLAGAQPNFSTPIIFQKAPFGLGDIELINAHEVGGVSITVLAESPFRTFDDLHKAIKAQPGKITIAFPRGGSNQLLALLLKEKLGWDALLVPYDSGAATRTALLGGHVTAIVNGAVSDAELKPRVRSLTLSTPTKLSVWPDSPYINDILKAHGARIPDVGDVRFFAFKKGVRAQHPDRWEKLLRAYQAAMKNPEYRTMIEKMGAAEEADYRGPEQSQRIIDDLHNLLVEHRSKFEE